MKRVHRQTTAVYVSLPIALHRRLRKQAQVEERTMSQVVNRILRRFFEELDARGGNGESPDARRSS